MRQEFAGLLHKHMASNSRIFLLTGDLGYGLWDQIRIDYPDRFINVGSSEQLMMGIAVGMAQEGLIPVVYSITPFLLYRPFETIRNYLNEEKANVKLIGGGRNRDYGHLGFSHWAEEDVKVMRTLPNIKSYWPDPIDGDLESITNKVLTTDCPAYVNLKR